MKPDYRFEREFADIHNFAGKVTINLKAKITRFQRKLQKHLPLEQFLKNSTFHPDCHGMIAN